MDNKNEKLKTAAVIILISIIIVGTLIIGYELFKPIFDNTPVKKDATMCEKLINIDTRNRCRTLFEDMEYAEKNNVDYQTMMNIMTSRSYNDKDGYSLERYINKSIKKCDNKNNVTTLKTCIKDEMYVYIKRYTNQ